MGKKKSLSSEVRAQIVALAGEGYSERQLAQRFGCSKTAVHGCLVRYQQDNTFTDSKRSGRPRVTTRREDGMIRRIALRSPSSSCRKIRADLLRSGTKVSMKTVSRRLVDDFGLKSRKPAAKPRLTPAMLKRRLQFAEQYRNWTSDDWGKVLFSDESMVEQFNSRVKYVRRPVGERYNKRYTVMTMKHPPKQMVWGAMSVNGTAGLYFLEQNVTMNGEKYLDLLKDKLQLHMSVHKCTVFMHDGAPCHKTKKVSEYLRSIGVDVLQWPGNSPDLNPIENLWSIMKNKVAEKQPGNIPELIEAIKLVWVKEITKDYCRKLIESMPRRLEEVIRNKGGHTKY